jgi:hypothetical protein
MCRLTPLILKLLILFSFLSLLSCTNKSRCIDPFFDYPTDQWLERSKNLPLERLMELHQKQVCLHSVDLYFVREIGRRGKAGVEFVIDTLQRKKVFFNSGQNSRRHFSALNNSRLFFTVLTFAQWDGGYYVCEDPEKYKKLKSNPLSYTDKWIISEIQDYCKS